MAWATLLLGVQMVASSESGAGLKRFLAEKAADLRRRNQALHEKVGAFEHRMRIRSALASDLEHAIRSFSGFSDSLAGASSVALPLQHLETRPVRSAPATGHASLPSSRPLEKVVVRPKNDFHTSAFDRAANGQILMAPRDRHIDAINAVFDRHRPALQYLYRRALKRDPGLKGGVTLRFKLTAAGCIKDLEMLESSLSSQELQAAILEKVRRWKDFGEVPGSNENKVYVKTFRFGD